MQGTGAPRGLDEETKAPQEHASPGLHSGAERTIVFLVPFALMLAALAALAGSGLAEAPPAMVVAAVSDDTTSGTAEPHGPPPTTLPQLTTHPAPPSTVTTLASQTSASQSLTTRTPASRTPATTASTTAAPTTTSTVVATIPPTTARPEDVARARGEQALALISYDWRQKLPGWTISFHPGRSGVLGYTFVNERRIEVYVRTEQPNSLLAHVIAHELGHAVDVTLNDGESFAAWQVGDGSFRSKLGSAPNSQLRSLMATLADG